MTSDHGWVEPVDAGETIAQQDDLEHWLHGIRTGLADNPPDWLATAAPSASDAAASGSDGDGAQSPLDPEAPLDPTAPPASGAETDVQPRAGQTSGRHRAQD
jgi:hypothetical protein